LTGGGAATGGGAVEPEPAADPVAGGFAAVAPEPVVDGFAATAVVPEPVAAAVADPVAGAVADPVAGAVADPVAGAVADPVAGAVADPVAGTVADPVAGAVADPVAGAPDPPRSALNPAENPPAEPFAVAAATGLASSTGFESPPDPHAVARAITTAAARITLRKRNPKKVTSDDSVVVAR
jgi:hypothetical protein